MSLATNHNLQVDLQQGLQQAFRLGQNPQQGTGADLQAIGSAVYTALRATAEGREVPGPYTSSNSPFGLTVRNIFNAFEQFQSAVPGSMSFSPSLRLFSPQGSNGQNQGNGPGSGQNLTNGPVAGSANGPLNAPELTEKLLELVITNAAKSIQKSEEEKARKAEADRRRAEDARNAEAKALAEAEQREQDRRRRESLAAKPLRNNPNGGSDSGNTA